VDTAFAPPEQNARPLLYRAGLLSWAPAVPGLSVPMANAYLYAAWSTDGHLYAPPFGADFALRSGEVAELLPLDAGISWFRGVFGAVGLPDGRIIAIPHSRSAWLELAPEGRVTVPMEAMTSPFLNKL
jgi:hypothetical protein